MLKYLGKCLLIKIKKQKVLVVGDLHLGYEEALNRSGILLSREMLNQITIYLDKVFKMSGKVDKVILLGDVKHSFGQIMAQEWKDVLNLLDYLKQRSKQIIIVKGNHDKILQPIAKKEDISLKDYEIIEEFCFMHGDKDFPEAHDKKVKYWVLGHAHPAIKLSDKVKTEKFKAFLVGKYKNRNVIILPSFFTYSHGSDPRENDLRLAWKFNLNNFEAKIVQDNSLKVLNFGKIKRIS